MNELGAVLNDGTWGTIIRWLDHVGYGRVPFGCGPPVTRNHDGSLNVATLDGPARADFGDYVILRGDYSLGVRAGEERAAA